MASNPHLATPSANGPFDVLVLGAGMAGLACARTLAEAGQRVCLVEAAERVGGRILTHRMGDQVIELGAEFIHGRPPELLALIAEAGLTVVERTGSSLSVEAGQLTEESGAREGMFDPLEQLRSATGPDRSFSDFLATSGFARNPDLCESARSYVEGFNAADATVISALSLGMQQTAEDSIDGERVAHIAEGYDRLPRFLAERFLAAGGTLRLGTAVTAVHWATGRVAFETTSGELTAARAVITLPLGVLQAGTVHIVPEPHAILAAAGKLRMGPVARFTLLFREPFWQHLASPPGLSAQALQELSFLFSFDHLPSVWWTAHPEEASRTLTGWVGGPRASTLLGKSSADLANLACRALAGIFSVPESLLHGQLEATLTHNWSADGNTLGAYSYVAVGGVQAAAQLAAPLEHTLFFAGEHTDTTGHWATVHGALRSGLRAAGQVLGIS